jgi:hypothetical protein
MNERALAAALFLLPFPAAAAEVTPLVSLRVLGGQYFFQGDKGALSGNFSALFAPAVRIDERWAVLPSVSSSYQGTKQVIDLVGAGTLFQEQMDHRLASKLVFQPADSLWRFKGGVGYKAELLRETRDESWTKGLFDYQSVNVGLESEYVFEEPCSVRAGYDYAYTFFPNYSSLESRAAMDFQGQPLARELVGDRVLDTHAHMLSAAVDVPLQDRATLQAGARLTLQDFPNQPIVDAAGQLTAQNRADSSGAFDLSLRMPFEWGSEVRSAATVDLGAASQVSDQNSYDARQTRFIGQYYNYGQVGGGAGFQLLFGDERLPISWSNTLAWTYRRYPHRPIQDAAGLYLAPSLHQHSLLVSTTFKYPMAPRFALLFNFQFGRTTSNQQYEELYRYNYSATNYLFGFTYDY